MGYGRTRFELVAEICRLCMQMMSERDIQYTLRTNLYTVQKYLRIMLDCNLLREIESLPYRKYYKKGRTIHVPLSQEEFEEDMRRGKFIERKHKGFMALIFHTGIYKIEALRARKEQFRIWRDKILFDLGDSQAPYSIPLSASYADEIVWAIENTEKGERVFPYSEGTGKAIIGRVIKQRRDRQLSRYSTGRLLPVVRTLYKKKVPKDSKTKVFYRTTQTGQDYVKAVERMKHFLREY